MPDMTLSEAAAWAGKTRPTIHKALKSGRLSGRQDDDGIWHIDPAELERVYPPRKPSDVSGNSELSTHDISQLIAAKEREIALLREIADAAQAEAAEWKAEASKWHAQADAQTRLLTHQKAEPAPAVEASNQAPAQSARRGLIARMFGQG
jgi:hypothetical protein